MALVSYKCPNCDGELVFDPAVQKYKCEYCMSFFSQQELNAIRPKTADEPAETSGRGEPDGSSADEDLSHGNALLYNCPSCGAEIVTDDTTAATFCYYCHNPVILGGRLEGNYLPDMVIPFEITKDAAVEGFLNFAGKKKFVPRAFWDKRQIESISGVYFPYWIYDVKLDGRMLGDAKKIRKWRSGNTEYTETRHYAVLREGDVELSGLTENALKKANSVLAQGVMPFEFQKMKQFHMGYLSGFLAERRDIERRDVEEKMRHTMRESAEKLMRETITGYNFVSVSDLGFVPKREDWHYVLFPIWTITYKGKGGRVYFYSMNGQTGKVCGELPIAYGKVWLVSLLTAFIVLILGLAGGFYL